LLAFPFFRVLALYFLDPLDSVDPAFNLSEVLVGGSTTLSRDTKLVFLFLNFTCACMSSAEELLTDKNSAFLVDYLTNVALAFYSFLKV